MEHVGGDSTLLGEDRPEVMLSRLGRSRTLVLLAALALVNVALFAAYSAVITVLIPRQVQLLAPADKVGGLAMVLSISFAATAVAQPLVGAISDRTAGRLGRRLPWMIGGAVVGGAALVVAGGAASLGVLVVAWAVGQFALNGADIAASAYLVDRIPPARRGLAFAIVGVAAILGGAIGVVFAGHSPSSTASTYWSLAGAVIGAVCVFALVVRPGGQDTISARSLPEFVRQFWVNPRRHPDFVKVLGWKLSSTLAYAAVHGYLLYLLIDYIRLGEVASEQLVGLMTIVGGTGVVVGLFAGGWLSDRLRLRTPFLIAGGALVVVGDLVAVLAPSIPGMLLLAATLGLSLGLAISCGTALGSELLPHPAGGVGSGMGILNLSGNLGQAAAPLLAAATITATGGYVWLFGLSIAAALTAIAFVVSMGRR